MTEANVKMSSYCKMCVINETRNIKTDQEAHLLFLFLFIATSVLHKRKLSLDVESRLMFFYHLLPLF